MGTVNVYLVLTVICGIVQVLALQNDHEPMVAFVCGKPAMHRGVNGWISDDQTKECWDDKRTILDYCRKMYPNHNITNVVEAAYLVTIPGWPSLQGNTLHTHRVRPFRCIVDNFQSDALLVPQNCKFDHRHDEKVCKGFSHWEVRARDVCAKDGMYCKSFGLLLNCGLGTFSGVEFVCCPKQMPQNDTIPSIVDSVDVNLYELYLKGEPMPANLVNEHQRFEAARQYMHKLQEAENAKLMKEWTAARDHVNEIRKDDPRRAKKLSTEITQRFQRLYSASEQKIVAEKEQIVALHQQRVQADLNQRKRVAMDKFMRYLQKGDVAQINKSLRNYIKVEEKDILHTVNHYSHIKSTNLDEATRIHSHVIQHLKLCQQRMEQALEMLERYPDVEPHVRPQIEAFLQKYNNMADRIRNVVLPDPDNSNIHSDNENHDGQAAAAEDKPVPQASDSDYTNIDQQPQAADNAQVSEEVKEDEHDLDRNVYRPSNQQHSKISVQQNLHTSSVSSSSQVGATFGIAIGSVAIFVVLVVAVVMLRRRSSTRTNVTHGYVEVDPAASPEERHVANMQMNGYENPTYRYFEVQSTK